MKRLVLRALALAAVLLLGCIAIVYAQRQTDSPDSQDSDSANTAVVLGEPRPQPTVPVSVVQLNPLRGTPDPDTSPELPPVTYPAQQPTTPPDTASYPSLPPVPAGTAASNEPTAAGAPPDLFGLRPAGQLPPPSEPRPAATQSSPRYDAPTGKAEAGGPYPDPVQSGAATPNRFPAEASSAPLANYDNRAPSANGRAARPAVEPGAANGYAIPSGDSQAAPFAPRARQPEAEFHNEGTGRPATDRRFDGQQAPQLSIQKVAPEEIQVGKPAVFRVEVKNTGPITAQQVEIRDQIPAGTTLVDTKPAASRGTNGELIWTLGKIEPGSGASVEMQVMPTAEGEIGSVATVSFSASASIRTHATKPQLVLNVTSPQTIMIEGQMTLSITVSNPGSGVATNVVLEEHVPPCLQHPAGAELEYEVGDLAPNESRTLELKLAAVRPGRAANLLIARADAVEEVKKQLPIEVVAPQLKIEMSGPRSRYLERQATYEVAVSNPGTAPARDVRLTAELPRGLKFVSANNNGHYDPQSRTVQWALAELPSGETAPVQLTTLPVEIGRHTFQLSSTAEKALTVKEEEQILVDGIAAIRFEVVDVQDPIEVGGETVYEIRVLNQGSKEATQVCLAAELAPGLAVVAAEGPDSLGNRMQGNCLVFDPLPRLSPKVDVTYRVRVQGRQPGDQRIRVQLTAAELQSPVTKEESTRVFSDK